MKKLLGVSVVVLVASVLCMYNAAKNCYSIGEDIDANEVKGGACYKLTNFTFCAGDNLTCDNTVCPPAYSICQIEKKTTLKTNGYFKSTESVETGGQTSSKSISVHCADEQQCGRNCWIHGTSTTRYCGASSDTPPTPVNKTGKELVGPSC
jgi:hypothetical protein